MTYRRAAIPAVVGGLLVTVLLWWAGVSAHALRLPGSVDVLGGGGISDLERWPIPWSYDPLAGVAAAVQTGFSGRGLYSEPGDLIRQRLLLGGWAGPGSTWPATGCCTGSPTCCCSPWCGGHCGGCR